jgi:hypothetical protein
VRKRPKVEKHHQTRKEGYMRNKHKGFWPNKRKRGYQKRDYSMKEMRKEIILGRASEYHDHRIMV